MSEKKELILGFLTLTTGLEDFEKAQQEHNVSFGLFMKANDESGQASPVAVCAPTTADAIDTLKRLEADKKPASVRLLRVKVEEVTELHKDISY